MRDTSFSMFAMMMGRGVLIRRLEMSAPGDCGVDSYERSLVSAIRTEPRCGDISLTLIVTRYIIAVLASMPLQY